MEQMLQSLTFPCKYDDCKESAVGTKILAHIKKCQFYPIKCPLYYRCGWSGSVSAVIKHCALNHPENIYLQEKRSFKAPNFKSLTIPKTCHVIFFVFEKVFRFTLQILQYLDGTAIVQLGVYLLENKNRCKKEQRFEYKVSFFNDSKDKCIILGTTCPTIFTTDETNINCNKSSLSVSFANICELCAENGDLVYDVEIIDKRKLQSFEKTQNDRTANKLYYEKSRIRSGSFS